MQSCPLLVAMTLGLWLGHRLARTLVATQSLTSQLISLDPKSEDASGIALLLKVVAADNATEAGSLTKDLARLQEQILSSLDLSKPPRPRSPPCNADLQRG